MKDIKLPFISRPETASTEPNASTTGSTPSVPSSENETETTSAPALTIVDGPTGESKEDSDAAEAAHEADAAHGEAKSGEYMFKCFPDGSLFRYGAHPDGSGRQCLIDSVGTTVGVVSHKAIADFLVRGAHCLCCILRDEATNQDKQAGLVNAHGQTIGAQAVRPASSNIKID